MKGCCFLFPLQRYHTPPRSKSRSESEGERGSSETPPHWKEEMQRTKAYQPPSVERWSKGERFVLTPFENGTMISVIFKIIVHAKLIFVVYFKRFILKLILFILSF